MLPIKNVECDGCGIESSCTPWGRLWYCPVCVENYTKSNSVLIDSTKILTESRAIDSSIRFSGDIFNAETVSIAELKTAIDNDDSIPLGEKAIKLHLIVTERLELYKERILDLDKQKHELFEKQQANFMWMREYASEIRGDIRERIKRADSSYIDSTVVKIPKEIKSRVSPMEKMVQQYSIIHNMSLDDARASLRSNKQPSNIDPNDPFEKSVALLATINGTSLDEAREFLRSKQQANKE